MGRSAAAGARAVRPWILVLDQIEEGVTDHRFEVRAEDLDLADSFFAFSGPLAVRLTIGRTLQMLSVQGAVTGLLSGECCRCLAVTRSPLRAPVGFLLQRRQARDEEVEALATETDVDFVDPGAKVVDLADRLRDAVALELPLRVYCRPDCKGLCPRCGQDLNAGTCDCAAHQIDPRWEALTRLKG